jgi:putative transposase
MRRSKCEVYLHMVWATYRRLPLIIPEIESEVHGLLAGEARRLRCEVLAVGGTADHVHVALTLPSTVSVSRLAQQLKGVSSTRVRQQIAAGATFGWQDNYGAFSFSRSHRDRVVAYIRDQKRRHAAGMLWRTWEIREEAAER